MSMKLTPDTQAPALSLPTLDGGTWTLADQSPENFTMVIFYRGVHCPVCKSYLEGLKPLLEGYADQGFSVVAASMDTPGRAAKTAAEWDIGDLTIAHSMSEETAKSWGLWTTSSINDNENTIFAEPGLFWVRPDGRLYLIDISNMPWARPDLAFLLSKAPFAIEKGYPARGTRAA